MRLRVEIMRCYSALEEYMFNNFRSACSLRELTLPVGALIALAATPSIVYVC